MSPPPAGGGRSDRFPLARLVLLVGGGAALLAGLWSGLGRVGVAPASGPVAEHGIVMVLGFLGTLIALERAVALRARWAYTGPALAVASTMTLLLGFPPVVAGMMLTSAGLVIVAVYLVTLRPRLESYLAVMAVGAVLWVMAAALWTAGWSPVRLSPLLAGFLVLTIVGERLELSRLRVPDARARRPLLAACTLFVVGVSLALVAWAAGLIIAGAGLVAQTIWLARHDVARVTIRRPGLPRFAAACMLTGYVWLAVGGLLWIAWGLAIGGPLVRDAALHAVFLGFAISMVMGHAPIILPAVLRTPLPHRRVAWAPLVLLHTSVALRVGADLVGSTTVRAWAGSGNVAALLLFAVLAATTAIVARRATDHHPHRPTVQAIRRLEPRSAMEQPPHRPAAGAESPISASVSTKKGDS